MNDNIIVYDSDGNQISPKQNTLVGIFKNVSIKDIVANIRQIPSLVQVVKDLIPTETVKLVFSKHTQELLMKELNSATANTED